MEENLKRQFVDAYQGDRKYKAIVQDLVSDSLTVEGIGSFSRASLPFVLTDGLLYNVQPNGLRSLYILYSMVKTMLNQAHDAKHHFGVERMLYDLYGLAIARKTY